MLLMLVFMTMNWCLNLLGAFYWLTLTQKQRYLLGCIFKCEANSDFRKRLMRRTLEDMFRFMMVL